MKSPKNTLASSEKIKSRKLFEQLFKNSRSIREFPFRVVYKSIPFDARFPLKMAVSVPARNMPLAVNRNRMKRLVREAFRINRHSLADHCRNKAKGLAILFVVQLKSPCSFEETQEKIILLLQRLITLDDKAAE